LNEPVSQRRLAMVNVGDDGEIADMTQITHGSTLKRLQADCPPKNSRELYLKEGWGVTFTLHAAPRQPLQAQKKERGNRSFFMNWLIIPPV
jgi:hypothetical protein